jgi:hypothetical protein
LDDSAILRPSARTFLFRSWPKVAGTLTVRLTAADEHRSAAIAVTGDTAALLATELLAGAGNVGALARARWQVPRRFSSCQVTTRCRMSARGSTPNTASFSSTSPALAASRVETSTFMA